MGASETTKILKFIVAFSLALSIWLIVSRPPKVNLNQIEKEAQVDFREGRYANAEAGFLELLHKPRSVRCLCTLAVLQFRTQRYDTAQLYLRKAVTIDDQSGLVHYLLGKTFFFQNDYDNAIHHLRKGIHFDPDNANCYNYLGLVMLQKGLKDKAENAFRDALFIEPNFGEAHYRLAFLLSKSDQDKFEEVKFHYFKALEFGRPRDLRIEDILVRVAYSKKGG